MMKIDSRSLRVALLAFTALASATVLVAPGRVQAQTIEVRAGDDIEITTSA